MSNPNNCDACGHKARPEGGWCYMFRDEPADICMAHTMRNTLYDIGAAMKLIASDPSFVKVDKAFCDSIFGEKK